MLKLIRALYRLINIVIIATLLTLHFYIKDSSYQSSMFFYFFALPIIIMIVLGLSVFLGKWRIYNLILAGLLLLVWLGRSFSVSFPETFKKTDLEIVFWNACRNHGFETAFKAHGSRPDVMVLTESNEHDLEALQLKYPKSYFYISESELRIFSKTPIEIIREETSKFSSTIINFKTNGVNFYALDMTGSSDVPRAWEFKFFYSIKKDKHNTVIVGDFNVPYESLFLKALKRDYEFYFSSKGNGFRETWFWGLPFLALDQIWTSKDLEVVASKKINTKKSDHSMIKTVIRK
ncbi:endonuclease/exonuclease/phosphatase family protein [Mariniflexile ostreae]|uniref:Endonuclease/exonuclease/phosphatase family protein n=1 Tax=Mariniflexile ostreae TaxID=1520892 RepID=A0ABV5FCM4_9FLAO